MKKQNFKFFKKKEEEIIDETLTEIEIDETTVLNVQIKGMLQKDKKMFNKFDGYILYRNEGNDWKLFQTTNLKEIFKYKNRAYLINKVEGRLNGKPLFIIDSKIPITVNTIKSDLIDEENNTFENGIDLCYDPRLFYTLLDYVNLSNLSATQEKESAVGNFIKDNFIIILFFGAVLAFVMFTPMGRKMIGLV